VHWELIAFAPAPPATNQQRQQLSSHFYTRAGYTLYTCGCSGLSGRLMGLKGCPSAFGFICASCRSGEFYSFHSGLPRPQAMGAAFTPVGCGQTGTSM